jgi:hypothetical protein
MPAPRAPIARRAAGKRPGAKPVKAAAPAKARTVGKTVKARARTKTAARPRREAPRATGKRGGRGGRRR